MARFPFDIVGFDLDGTLVDTSPDLTAAVNHALAAAGRPLLTPARVTPMIGGGAKNMLRQSLEASGGCDDAEFRRLYRLLLDHYGDHLADGSAPYPGAVAALDALAARDVRLAVVTNKFEAFANRLLSALGLRERFGVVIGGDTMGKGFSKPHRAPIDAMIARLGGGSAAFVGDSVYDIGAARAAGIPSIAVSFGFLLGPVEGLGADGVIDEYGALIPELERVARGAR
ncbi:phosphoglycolate phosphatase [Sphingomonas sp.]|uniref:phosphoglycolate phosphatase n=1 Tax=Sphingomonas sp. TaxID=28214 RepID=UPI001EC64E39|nr:phosphoglycolate phosphatase [Sphingomonas sp.]MBX3594018.1 phosphoglycolate phosphatase [Sphingomonas sp.]